MTLPWPLTSTWRLENVCTVCEATSGYDKEVFCSASCHLFLLTQQKQGASRDREKSKSLDKDTECGGPVEKKKNTAGTERHDANQQPMKAWRESFTVVRGDWSCSLVCVCVCVCVCKCTVGCVYFARIDDNIKKEVRRRDEIEFSMQMERDVKDSKADCECNWAFMLILSMWLIVISFTLSIVFSVTYLCFAVMSQEVVWLCLLHCRHAVGLLSSRVKTTTRLKQLLLP